MKFLSVVIMICFLSGCASTIDADSYSKLTPQFSLEQFFDGNVKAWGIVQDSDGNVTQRFTVNIDGIYKNGELTLDETFEYGLGDGPKKRIWTISKQSNNLYTGAANDIAGPASGRSYGNAFYWGYEMDLPVDDTTYLVKFDDWIWAFDNQTIINRSYIRKFGITFAEVTIFMRKQP